MSHSEGQSAASRKHEKYPRLAPRARRRTDREALARQGVVTPKRLSSAYFPGFSPVTAQKD